jgi:hypothetical protein
MFATTSLSGSLHAASIWQAVRHAAAAMVRLIRSKPDMVLLLRARFPAGPLSIAD